MEGASGFGGGDGEGVGGVGGGGVGWDFEYCMRGEAGGEKEGGGRCGYDEFC